jgi:murein L,D-transpeptidase YafK
MNNSKLFLYLIFLISMQTSAQSFKASQIKNQRVKESYLQQEENVKKRLKEIGIQFGKFDLFFRSFKNEMKFEVWIRNKTEKVFTLYKIFDICASSGTFGPKRKEGDLQVPEGFYYVDVFNPWSSYDLSMRINYPNASDRILSDKKHPGGNICIHGECVTIGCIPLAGNIREIYLLAVEAHNAGQTNIPVHIFPTKLDPKSLAEWNKNYKDQPNLIAFWNNLTPGYAYFEKNKSLPLIKTGSKGEYIWNF